MIGLQKRVIAYISILTILASTILYQSVFRITIDWSFLKIALFLISMSIILESFTIKLPKGGQWSVAFAVDLAAIVIFGPWIAVWIALTGELFKHDNLRFKNPSYKILFNLSQFVISTWVAGMVYQLLGGRVDSTPISYILPFVGATITYAVVNMSAVTLILTIAEKQSAVGVFSANFRWVYPNFLAFAPLSVLMATVYKVTGIWGTYLFVIPLLLARYIFKSYMETREIYLDTLEALASALDAKDGYTKGHSDRVALYAVKIAHELGLPEHKVETIEQMALLHDIGKIGISDELLSKPGKLSTEEFERIKTHPVIGAKILNEMYSLGQVVEYIKFHHEKYDGSGYPFMVKGEEIPLESRIITLADSFDAMTSDRSYRLGMSFNEAIKEVERSAGTHFDPQIVEAFIKLFNKDTAFQCVGKVAKEF